MVLSLRPAQARHRDRSGAGGHEGALSPAPGRGTEGRILPEISRVERALSAPELHSDSRGPRPVFPPFRVRASADRPAVPRQRTHALLSIRGIRASANPPPGARFYM